MLGRLACRIENLRLSCLACRLLNLHASDDEVPVVAIVEEKEKFLPWFEHTFQSRAFHSRVALLRLLADVGKERVFLVALVGILEIVIESVAVVAVEFYRLENRFRKIPQGMIFAVNEGHGEIPVRDMEGDGFLHGRVVLGSRDFQQ